MEKQYKVLKPFSLKDLYLDNCPVEIFEGVLKTYLRWSPKDFNLKLDYLEDVFNNKSFFNEKASLNPQWFIDNGYIEEIIPDIELKPGMVLEDSRLRKIFVDDKMQTIILSGFNDGIPGEVFTKIKRTLNALNDCSYYTWRIKQ